MNLDQLVWAAGFAITMAMVIELIIAICDRCGVPNLIRDPYYTTTDQHGRIRLHKLVILTDDEDDTGTPFLDGVERWIVRNTIGTITRRR